MPLIKITPKLKTESAEFYELEGRRLAIVRVDPSSVSMDTLKDAHSIISNFLDMEVLMLTFDADIEIVEALPPTRYELLEGRDD